MRASALLPRTGRKSASGAGVPAASPSLQVRGGGRGRSVTAAVVLAAALTGAYPPASAGAVRETVIRPDEPLQSRIDALPAGAVARLLPGRHDGPIHIDRSLSLVGEPGAMVVGPGTGSVIIVRAPDVRIEGLEITGSGRDVPAMDSAILLEQAARGAQVRSNRLIDNLFGVYVHGAADSRIEDNRIDGRRDLRLAEAGNGVSIWNAPGTQVVGNAIRYGRDGIYVKTSSGNLFARNTFEKLRFAIHYMYTHDSRVIGNRSRGNHVAWAIMYSERLEIRDNVSDDDRDHGLMLNSTNRSVVSGNVVRRGREKCAFVYAANDNRFEDNWFEACPIGIHFTAGSSGNTMSGNAFIGNRTQVKYVGTSLLDWAHEGRGNYWSDNPAFDLDGDGIADRPYRPNDVIDEILWTLPAARVLTNSPAVQTVRWAQARFPALYPGGVIDSAPLMRPPGTPAAPLPESP